MMLPHVGHTALLPSWIRRCCCLAAGFVAGGLFAAAPRPQFVVFLSDDHGWADSTPYGAKDVRTPQLQRLADAGLKFTHAFVASPACGPSRAAMLTGLMPARNGAEANHTFKRAEIRSLPDDLRRLGYETAAFGKVSHNENNQRHGFDHQDKRWDAATVRGFLDARDAVKPLCLFVGTRQPHTPWLDNQGYDPAAVLLPPTLLDTPETRAARCRYYTDVSDMDRELGEIRALARERLGRDCVFLYTSDNGAQWPFSKWSLTDAGIRTPLIVEWPGVVRGGTQTDALVGWVDLLPTLIELAGGTPPRDIDGRSFAGVIRGERAGHREVIFATHSGDGRMNVYPIRGVRRDEWKYILNLHPEFAYTTHIDQGLGNGMEFWRSWVAAAETDARAAAVVRRYHARPREELYDLRADPHELRNLAADPQHAARLAALRAELEAWMNAQGDRRMAFERPRMLSDPASYEPGAGAREAKARGKAPKTTP